MTSPKKIPDQTPYTDEELTLLYNRIERASLVYEFLSGEELDEMEREQAHKQTQQEKRK